MAPRAAGGAGRITLWGVEVFAAVAEAGAVSVAARRLGASASAVSQQIANLEAALGAPLFDRAARPMALTGAGRLFLRRAQRILDEAARARAELTARDLTGLETLRIGAIEDFDATVSPELLANLADNLPRCHFHLETGASHHLVERLEARSLDVAIAAQTGPVRPGWMEAWPLLSDPFVLALPARLATLSDQPAATAGALPDLPFIHYTARHMMGRLIEGWLARQSLDLPRRFELDSYHAIMAMVAAGAGWSIVTPLGFAAAHRFRARVSLAPLPGPAMSRTICVFARAGQMGDLPGDIAARAGRLIAREVTAPLVAAMPFLAGRLGPPDAGA
jgi:DNA-binding transcriptional LysR family regulator